MPYCDVKEIKMKEEKLCMYASLYADAYLIFVFKLAKLNFGSMYGCTLQIKSLTTEKQTTKFSSANFQKMLSPSYIIVRIQRLGGKQCRSR